MLEYQRCAHNPIRSDPIRDCLARIRSDVKIMITPFSLISLDILENLGMLESLCWQSGTCDQFGHMSAMRMLKMHSPQVNLIKT